MPSLLMMCTYLPDILDMLSQLCLADENQPHKEHTQNSQIEQYIFLQGISDMSQLHIVQSKVENVQLDKAGIFYFRDHMCLDCMQNIVFSMNYKSNLENKENTNPVPSLVVLNRQDNPYNNPSLPPNMFLVDTADSFHRFHIGLLKCMEHVCGTFVRNLGKEIFRTPIAHTGTDLNIENTQFSTLYPSQLDCYRNKHIPLHIETLGIH